MMVRWAIAFFILTTLAGVLGFAKNDTFDTYAADAGKVLFFIFFVLFSLSFFFRAIGKLNGGNDDAVS